MNVCAIKFFAHSRSVIYYIRKCLNFLLVVMELRDAEDVLTPAKLSSVRLQSCGLFCSKLTDKVYELFQMRIRNEV
jgi:hypothetical protein